MSRNTIPAQAVTPEIIDNQAIELFQVLTTLPSRNIEALVRIGTNALVLFHEAENPDHKAEIASIAIHAERGVRMYGNSSNSPLTSPVKTLKKYLQHYDKQVREKLSTGNSTLAERQLDTKIIL